MTRESEIICCPVCHGTVFEPLLEKSGWKIVRCPSCSIAMINPRRTNSTEIYVSDSYFSSDDFYYDYIGNKAAYQKGFRRKLQEICRLQPNRGKLLDVGAAYGFFMEEANKVGFESVGIELAPAAAAHARKYGEVLEKPLEAVDIDAEFSVVCFIDSLEHFEDPLIGLQKAWDLLEDDGIVAIMVPNIESWFARLAGNKWHLLLPEEHLFYFSHRSVSSILVKAGFEVVHQGTGGYGRSVAEIARVLLRGRWSLPRPLENALRQVSFHVNLGDIFAIGKKSGARRKHS